ncbi:hypothetical protein CGCSCA4_v001629 [Colletotrichum siamense]|uniref:Uncharacterized protein n=1 Tax=Colletotrichum siamense TaxID=690259 RepID=A0A9P5KA99_COLSI|nr:hypothetical protein CGCSCA4_v001629 [Colletotrichum siamense]KAF4864511.1 hypothetical protein CGCSCA2_v001765 [Colletotrichum siamense]
MPEPTTYEPFVTTLTIPVEEYEQTVVFTLAPQTTPFTPSGSGCSTLPRDLRCQFQPDEITPGALCLADQSVQATSAWLPTECFPESYDNIWRPIGTKFKNLPRLAYPGTACLSGWTQACDTTVTLESAEHLTQTWCCPQGGWSCLEVSAGDIPYRDCVSFISKPTEVWVNNVVTSGGTKSTDWSSWKKTTLSNFPSSEPIKVKHPVFPLYARPPAASIKQAKGELSTGAIAGIVIGIVVVMLVFIGSAVFVCLRKRKQKAADRPAQSQVTAVNGDPHYKGLGYDTKQELPGHGSESRELQQISPPPAELSSQTKPSEVEGQPPVELAS